MGVFDLKLQDPKTRLRLLCSWVGTAGLTIVFAAHQRHGAWSCYSCLTGAVFYHQFTAKRHIGLVQRCLKLVCDLTQIGHPVFSQRIGKGHLTIDLPGDEFCTFG